MSLLRIILRTATNYLKDSSINGLSHAARARTKPKMLYWLILVVVGGLLTSYNIYDIIQDFRTYPVVTSTDIQKNSMIKFPAVTICNLNRIHCYRTFDRLQYLERVLFGSKSNNKRMVQIYTKDLGILKKIMRITGCLETICDSFYKGRNSVANTIMSLYISLGILCDRNSKFQCRNVMHEHDNASIIGKKRIIVALVQQKCDVTTICYFGGKLGQQSICKEDKPFVTPKEVKPTPPKGLKGVTPSIEKPTKPIGSRIDLNFKQEDEFNELFFELSPMTRRSIGHPINKIHSSNWNSILGLVINCSFKGNSCKNPKFWNVVNIPSAGNCFTFNTIFNKKDNNTEKSVSFTGVMNGLSLELYLNQHNYMRKGLSRRAGATVVIHDSATFPQIEEFGRQIQPSTATSISIEKKDFKLMPHPYKTDCINDWNETKYFKNIVGKNSAIYSLETCQKVCFQIKLIKRCKCQHVHLYTSLLKSSLLMEEDNTPLRTCSSIPSKKNSDFICHQNIQKEHDEGEWSCECKNPCYSTTYRLSMASSDWPSDFYMPIILNKTNQEPIKDYMDGLYRKRDFARVDVYFESLNVETVKATPKYTVDSYFAGLGGALSFYLGIAIIMVFEALELIFEVLVTCMREVGRVHNFQ